MLKIRTLLVIALVLLAPALWADELSNPELIKKGEYLARVGDCTSCHTPKDGKLFAGGVAMSSPIGTLYTTNITPDPATGIGSYSLEDFDLAVRHGISKSGYSLYPAMPYPSYAKVTDDDLKALYAFFMKGVEPVLQANREHDISWPLSIRWPVSIWRAMFAPPVATIAESGQLDYGNQRIARGAYLVQGLGHCGSCHTQRGLTQQEKALDDRSPVYLAGGPVIDGWVATSLRSNGPDGLENWTEADIIDTLRNGRNAHTASIGTMNVVVQQSSQHFSDEDLAAIAAYLKSLPVVSGSAKVAFHASDATAQTLKSGEAASRGAELYVDNCSACHRSNGLGAKAVFPGLAGNPSVINEDPSSMIRVVLHGSRLPSTQQAPSDLVMPDYAWRLNDLETAQLVSFIRNSWGNTAPGVSAAQVSAVRAALLKEQAAQH